MREMLITYRLGSILNSPTSGVGPVLTVEDWQYNIDLMQRVAAEVGIPPLVFGIDSIHGASYVADGVLFGQQINGGASFSRDLVYEQGSVTAKETRLAGIPWTFSPILDLSTQPLWSRCFETFGEDPYLAGELGIAFVEGCQGENGGDLTNPEKIAVSLKHFIGYGDPRSGHDRNPVWIPDHYLLNYWVPSFQKAIDAGAATIMNAYVEINGAPIIGSKRYLNDLVRDAMGFEGMIVTDWDEIYNLAASHRAADGRKNAIEIAFDQTSVDMSMTPNDAQFVDLLEELVNEGVIGEERVNISCARVMTLKEKLGLLDDPTSSRSRNKTIGDPEDMEKALELARQSITLLQNNNNILPLSVIAGNSILDHWPQC